MLLLFLQSQSDVFRVQCNIYKEIKASRWTHDTLTAGCVEELYSHTIHHTLLLLSTYTACIECFKCSWVLTAERIFKYEQMSVTPDHTGRHDRHTLLAYANGNKKQVHGLFYSAVVVNPKQIIVSHTSSGSHWEFLHQTGSGA